MAGRPCDICGGPANLFAVHAICCKCNDLAIAYAIKNMPRDSIKLEE